ncbi:MAG: NAD-dependent epimerase/dehydratase family protein, partial [Betaproteobacteria bacterium]|nr:NAD-dependent epimerase/dehydratase family protein [Betaproteobacteria bacterium]
TFAIIAGKDSGRYGTDAWSDTNADIGAYAKSKTLAERAAWEAVKGSDMELTVVNPGAVFGPSLGAAMDGQSVTMMTAMINGKMPMLPDMSMGMVDVRDVARLHVKAMTADGAAGKRFIAASAPTFLLKFMGLFDAEVRGMLPFIGKAAAYDNQATFDVLQWQPTPMETSFRDMAAALSPATRSHTA